jgi:hypothetical protein
MARIVPDGAVARVSFFEVHAPVWAGRAAEIGASPASVAAVRAAAEAARAALDAQELAQGVARAATQAFRDAVATLSTLGAEVIAQVKAKAAGSSSPSGGNEVYAAALLPVPAKPAPLGRPGTPTRFAADLRPDGSLELSWACANPAGANGTMYQISRQDGGGGGGGGGGGSPAAPFAVIGTTGRKRFVDAALPRGVAAVTYRVVAMRSTATGEAAGFTVNFGVAEGGAPAAAAAAARLAA